LSIAKVGRLDWSKNFVKDVGVTVGINYGTKNSAFGPNPKVLLLGPTFDLSVPGFAFLNVHVLAYRDSGTFSYAAHAVTIAVDPEIGDVEILDYVVVEDGGKLVNPMVVDGQIYGGLAQGIGTALYEEMPVDVRPRLLRFVREKVIYRVGSDKPQTADFRLICATNRDPFDAIKAGNLREDLYYRVNTIEITIPPLRDRIEDVPMLAEHFLKMYGEKYNKPDAVFARSAYDQMLNYGWRGNVRELQHSIERAVLLSKSGTIERLDISNAASFAISAGAGSTIGSTSAEVSQASPVETVLAAPQPLRTIDNFDIPTIMDGEEMFTSIGKLIVDRLPEPADGTETKDVFDGLESGVVVAALKRTNGNKQAAANLLGLYRPRLYGMIKRHKLEDQI